MICKRLSNKYNVIYLLEMKGYISILEIYLRYIIFIVSFLDKIDYLSYVDCENYL